MDNYEKLYDKVNTEHETFRKDIIDELKSKLDYTDMSVAVSDMLNANAYKDAQMQDICFCIAEGPDAYVTIDEDGFKYLFCEENLTERIIRAFDKDASMTVSENLNDVLADIISDNMEIEKNDQKIKEVCSEYDTNTERAQALDLDVVLVEVSNTNDNLRQRLADEGISNAGAWQDNAEVVVYVEDLEIVETALADNNVDYHIPSLEPSGKFEENDNKTSKSKSNLDIDKG